MASSGVNNGTLIKIYNGSTLITLAKSAGVDLTRAMRDISTKDSLSWKEILPGQQSFKFSVEILHDEAKAVNASTIMADQIAGTMYTVKLSSSVTGDKYFYGNAYLSSISIKTGVEDNETGSFTLEGTGELHIGTV